MKTKYLLFVLPLMALCACNKTDVEDVTNKVVSFTAIANDDTKTVINPDLSMSWAGGEHAWVYPLPTTYTGSGTYSATNLGVYEFINASEGGSTAKFTCSVSEFTPGSFGVGDPYFVICNQHPAVDYTFKYRDSEETDVISQYALWLTIPTEQTYNESNALGIADYTIPVYGFIQNGKDGFYPSSIKMRTYATIIKFVVTNNSSSNKTIHHIRLSNLSTNTVGISGGSYWTTIAPSGANFAVLTQQAYTYTTKYIDLSCGVSGVSLSNTVGSNTRTFSFVLPGGISRSEFGTLQWDIYSDASTIIASTTDPSTTKLQSGIIYTKSYTFN